jgi:cysteine desulfurase/selenocysteine lyase
LIYKNYCANVHRGVYTLAEEATLAYEESRKEVARLINAKSYEEILFVRNTTEAIKFLMLKKLKKIFLFFREK